MKKIISKENLIKEMKESIGTKDPLVFFSKMVDVFDLMFKEIKDLKTELEKVKINSIMAIEWDSRVALRMIEDEIDFMRKNGVDDPKSINVYADAIEKLKKAYLNTAFVYSYEAFCGFWEDTLGYHPFLESRS